jgi:hypothetical protein
MHHSHLQHNTQWWVWTRWWLVAGLLALGGCASVYRVDSQVNTHTAWPDHSPRPGDTYRIERLPSQNQGPAAADADALGLLLVPELARHGLVQALGPAAPGATWVVQVRRRETAKPHAPWDPAPGPWGGWQVGVGANRGGGNLGIGVNLPLWRVSPPYYEREVEVQLRHRDTARVVFESTARHDGPWQGEPALWSAMLEAALVGFPNPPPGARVVNKDLTRR